ncbi:TPA: hypothetical protein ACIYIM_004453 [Escherichia coli]
MKKSLIALAVTTATIMSGGVMAASWSNGSAGSSSFEMSGTLSPATATTPWEVAIGDSETNLNATMSESGTEGTINVSKVISVLGIRSVPAGFTGKPVGSGLLPQIQYGNNAVGDYIGNGKAPLSLDVMSGGSKIGSLKSEIQTVAVASNGTVGASLNANNANVAFYGGVARVAGNTVPAAQAVQTVQTLFPEALDNWDNTPVTQNTPWAFSNSQATFHAAYASGIPSGSVITITLDNALSSDTPWQANLPITVTYN